MKNDEHIDIEIVKNNAWSSLQKIRLEMAKKNWDAEYLNNSSISKMVQSEIKSFISEWEAQGYEKILEFLINDNQGFGISQDRKNTVLNYRVDLLVEKIKAADGWVGVRALEKPERLIKETVKDIEEIKRIDDKVINTQISKKQVKHIKPY